MLSDTVTNVCHESETKYFLDTWSFFLERNLSFFFSATEYFFKPTLELGLDIVLGSESLQILKQCILDTEFAKEFPNEEIA